MFVCTIGSYAQTFAVGFMIGGFIVGAFVYLCMNTTKPKKD